LGGVFGGVRFLFLWGGVRKVEKRKLKNADLYRQFREWELSKKEVLEEGESRGF